MKELEARLEAVLFAAGDAVSVERIANALGVTTELVYETASSLASQYDFDRRGILLARMEDRLQLASRPDYAEDIRRVTESRRPPSLGPAALEVLTIVAYRQPVTRAFVEQLRGVDSGATVSSLAEKGLIEEAGRLDVPGRPILYRTTDAFLRAFSISSLEELPALPALQTDNEQLTLDDLADRIEQGSATPAEPSGQTPDASGPPPDTSGQAVPPSEPPEQAEQSPELSERSEQIERSGPAAQPEQSEPSTQAEAPDNESSPSDEA